MANQLRIAVVAYEQVLPSALFGLGEVFATAERFRPHADQTEPAIVCRYLPAGSPVVFPDEVCWPDDAVVDVVILPPCSAGVKPECPDWLQAWLRHQHQQEAVMASACVGACLLAQTGLLDGRVITTHWLLEDFFRTTYPHIRLNIDAVVIEEADLITAGGIMAWLDLALRIIRRYYGAALVAHLGKYLLWDSGDREQRYYRRFQPDMNHRDEPILRVQQWLHAHFHETCTLTSLAQSAAMSERTLQRRFLRVTQCTISHYQQQLRLDKARELLETTQLPVEQIIWQVGYEDRASFSKLFKAQIGLSPQQYRQRFGCA